MRFTQIVIVALLSATTGLARPQQTAAPVRKFLNLPMPPGPPGVDGPKDVKGLIARAAVGAFAAWIATQVKPLWHIPLLKSRMTTCLQKRYLLTPLPAERTAENLAQWLTILHLECAKIFDPDHLTPPPKYSPEIFKDVATPNPNDGPPNHGHGPADHPRSPFRFDGRAAARLFKHLPAWRVGTERTLLKVEEEWKFAGQHF
ncbi:MAG: hypothetical protein M1826_007415 [Phylliscum demangeonii]|nr:MAG: hypothetical protein M1826_007415 [Phylliscum demangeonii]